MKVCACGATTYGRNERCGPCRMPQPHERQRQPDDLPEAEIERRYQQALAVGRYARRLEGL